MKKIVSLIGKTIPFGFLFAAIFLSQACIQSHPKTETASINDTSRLHPQMIDGLWEEVKHHHEPRFIYIQKDSVFMLQGEAADYKIKKDTILSPDNKAFMWKVLKVTKNEMVMLDRLRDTIWLIRK